MATKYCFCLMMKRIPDPYPVLMDPDTVPGGPKTYGSDGSATLVNWYLPVSTLFKPFIRAFQNR
jgi:hypothetical protein